MKRMALNLRVGQHVILPTGKAAKVLCIADSHVVLEYLEVKQPITLSRLFAVRLWGIDI